MSQNSKLRIATLTANYNNAAYIGECLDGLFAQTRKPNTIVIVDDASTDNSVKVVSEKMNSLTKLAYEKQDLEFPSCHWKFNNIEVILIRRKTNGGPAAARNVGVNYLLDKSDIIFIADADDIYYPKKIERSIVPFLKFNKVGLVYSDYDNFNVQTEQTLREYKEPFNIGRLYQECIVSNNSAVATSVFKNIGVYDESLRGPEDYDLWLRISDVAAIYHIAESLYKYRITGNNITVTTPPEKFAQQVRKVHEKARARHGIKQ